MHPPLGGEDIPKERPCNCELQDDLMRHYLLAGIPIEYWTLGVDDFFGDPNALSATNEYLIRWEDWKWHGMGLAFHSKTQGTGKTMLSTIVARDLVKRGERVMFSSFRDTLVPHDMPWELRQARITKLRTIPILVLDEVGTAITDAQWGYFSGELEDLIRHRTNGNTVTIVTTNLTVDELDNEYPRVFSLLSARQRHITVGGHDVRRSGDVEIVRDTMILNGWTRPIV